MASTMAKFVPIIRVIRGSPSRTPIPPFPCPQFACPTFGVPVVRRHSPWYHSDIRFRGYASSEEASQGDDR